MNGFITSLPHMPSWHAQKKTTFVIIELFDAACSELLAGSLNIPKCKKQSMKETAVKVLVYFVTK
jgi:hypothetical protein